MKKTTITIGIPAFNEGQNIMNLLSDISAQKRSTFTLEKVIVASDGSTDSTVDIAKKYEKLPMLVIANKDRKGVAARENQIIKNSSSDILIILNGDVRIKDTLFLQKIIIPIVEEKVDLVSAQIEEAKVNTFFEDILRTSMLVKHAAFNKYKNGNNIYTCFGVARAFSKKFYKKFKFSSSVGEDAYSYLYCVYHKFVYQCAHEAVVQYKLPTNLTDHQRQSIRFLQSKKRFEKDFGKDFVTNEYFLPATILLLATLAVFYRYPMKMMLYIIIVSYLQIKIIFADTVNNTWDISKSSKIIKI